MAAWGSHSWLCLKQNTISNADAGPCWVLMSFCWMCCIIAGGSRVLQADELLEVDVLALAAAMYCSTHLEGVQTPGNIL